jgi:WXG100 family type VII secretion target
MKIQVIHEAFRTAIHDVRTGAGQLRTARDRVDREVDGFLDTGWPGAAANSFGQGWDAWRVAAQDVHDGLVAMGQLLDAAHQDFVVADADSQARLDQIAQRIVDRLG